MIDDVWGEYGGGCVLLSVMSVTRNNVPTSAPHSSLERSATML